MSFERLQAAMARFERELTRAADTRAHALRPRAAWSLPPSLSRELLESMLLARHLDLLAHQLRHEGKGHYTITSSGHEANVVLGRLTRVTDPSILHYRSAALQLERARQDPSVDGVLDIALGLVAAAADPLCSGRHKAFGSKPLGIVPQTSTIASQLPRALGLAFGLDRARRLRLTSGALTGDSPADSIAMVGFGDASLNHSTAQGTLNAASWVVHQNLKLPLLFVCEDNQLGISVRTPADWVRLRLSSQPHLAYFHAEMWHLDRAYAAAEQAVAFCRRERRPAALHLECRRLLGHAGSDVDNQYRTREELEDAEAKDPVIAAALASVEAGALTAGEVLALNQAARERVAHAGDQARAASGLQTRAAVMAPLGSGAPTLAGEPRRTLVSGLTPGSEPTRAPQASDERAPLGTLAQGLNAGLAELLDSHPEALLFGEDVAKKGGVYGVTKGLAERAGPARVFNTLLDEQTILGLALGTATLGMLPIPEIQYLAYLHNAEDQLRGEAASLRFFSNDAFDNPMIVRIPGLAFQKGFGGHFHNDNSIAVLRDIPGIVVGVPARADDALGMLSQARDLALAERRVVVLIEPIALYHERHLYGADDGAWLAPLEAEPAPLDAPRVYQPDARDLLLISYGNGLRMCLRVSRALEREFGVKARVLDLRWLKPLPVAAVAAHVREIPRAVVVDECRNTGSVSEELLAGLVDLGLAATVRRVTSADSFIPLGQAADLVLLSEADIRRAAHDLIQLG